MAIAESCHWYKKDGTPCYEVKGKTGAMRDTTLADARKTGLLPSVSTILSILAKPGLVNWQIMRGIEAVTTAPDLPGEKLDAKIQRVLDAGEHKAESDAAAKLGTDVHTLLAHDLCYVGKEPLEQAAFTLARTAYHWLLETKAATVNREKSVFDTTLGYAGKADRIIQGENGFELVDWKTTKKLPTKGAWFEHNLQVAAYAQIAPCAINAVWVVYISTTEPDKIVAFKSTSPDWQRDADAFNHVFAVWRALKGYDPRNSAEAVNFALDKAGL